MSDLADATGSAATDGSAFVDAVDDDAMATPAAHGLPVLAASLRTGPEDFLVDELDAFAGTGVGEHLLLRIEKRGMNTAFAARRIAEWAGVDERAIGYAGMKDRHAVTRQRISVHLPKRQAPPVEALDGDDLRVLEHGWHAKKLPRGALAGNAFALTLRDVTGERAAIDARLQAIAARGVPNYFGGQRFGHGGDNVDRARRMFAGTRVRRDERALLLSAARSALFNQVLAARVAGRSWDQPLAGEAWMLDGSRSVFGPEPWSEALAARLAAFDIHPSAPLWGRGALRTAEVALAVEDDALARPWCGALRAGLEQAGLRQERRATRLRPGDLGWHWAGDSTLVLRFTLPPGSYATSLLAELGPCHDRAGRGPGRSSDAPDAEGRPGAVGV